MDIKLKTKLLQYSLPVSVILFFVISFSIPLSAKDIPTYNRSDYFTSWKDVDKNCVDTRNEVLWDESAGWDVTWSDNGAGCTIISGYWIDRYTGQLITDPKLLDIDHLVPLKEVHNSGGWRWSKEKKRAYAQDLSYPNHLIAVYKSANRSKGAKDPAHWIPPNLAFLKEYLMSWIAIKAKYNLEMDPEEEAAIASLLAIADEFEFKFPFKTAQDIKDLANALK